MIQDVPPELTKALGALAGPTWFIGLVWAVRVAASVIQMVKHQPTNGNGNGVKHVHIDGRDLIQITNTINSGFRDLRVDMDTKLERIANSQDSLAAYTMGVIKSLEAEARLRKAEE